MCALQGAPWSCWKSLRALEKLLGFGLLLWKYVLRTGCPSHLPSFLPLKHTCTGALGDTG